MRMRGDGGEGRGSSGGGFWGVWAGRENFVAEMRFSFLFFSLIEHRN